MQASNGRNFCLIIEIVLYASQERHSAKLIRSINRGRMYLESIRKERATRNNSQLATAQRVAMKMGRRLRCLSVTYPFRYAPSTASPAQTALPAAHFDRNQTYAYFGDRTLKSLLERHRVVCLRFSRRAWGSRGTL